MIATFLFVWLAGLGLLAEPADSIRVWELPQQRLSVAPGQYSGIAYLGGERYAVVDDNLPGGGIVFFEIPLRDDGTVRTAQVRHTVPEGTLASPVSGRDNEGVVYAGGRLYVSAEGDQSIREYDLDGRETGRVFAVPADLGADAIKGNAGFEALTYNAESGCFWTTTELPLPASGADSRLHPLQRFDSRFQPDGRWLYRTDDPRVEGAEAASARAYVFGISAMAALEDGRLFVLEREVYVPNESRPKGILEKAFAKVKLYVVDPSASAPGDVLTKRLLCEFETGISLTAAGIDLALANYEGMCLGPRLSDGRRCLLLIADSQAGMPDLSRRLGRKHLTHEFIKVLLF